MEKLFCDQIAIIIKNLSPFPDESERSFFKRELKILQTLADEQSLIILDNFDVDSDPDLDGFLNTTYRVLITTRNAHPGYVTIQIPPVKNPIALRNIFAQNYRLDKASDLCISDEDWTIIEQIFAIVEYHTYAIELIAKQMRASRMTAKHMLDCLTTREFSTAIMEPIPGPKKDTTAFGHIVSLFNISQLSIEEQKLMMCLSLMGPQGISTSRFIE